MIRYTPPGLQALAPSAVDAAAGAIVVRLTRWNLVGVPAAAGLTRDARSNLQAPLAEEHVAVAGGRTLTSTVRLDR